MFPGHFPFIWATNLGELSLQDTRIMLTLSSFRSMLLQLKSIKHLNLQRTQISKLPRRTLSHLPSLRILDLQGNYLATWNTETFSNVTQLEYLNLDGNRISIINETSFPIEFRSHIKKINHGNNDFLCTCALLWFRTWMKQAITNKTIRFVNYPNRYYCKNPYHQRLDHYNPTAESCKVKNPYVVAYVSSGIFVVVVVVAALLVYYNRWNIRYFMYTMRRRRYRQLPGREVEIKFDVFVSFDSEDSDWLMEEVADFLENDLNLKLCIHERDFEGGKMIIDNIVDCMDQSEKIIMIVSNNFARSNWCQCEVKMALNQQFEIHKDVIVVIREMVDRKYMFKSLKALLATTTYIEWKEGERAKQVFRNRLQEVMTRKNYEQ
ncbi:toll-like receptor 2 [Gigantopelta aegis]|uniref:toll-like receptor 2 n=1 Tax=Gigantopelta aegis TaxID=1735272 RepID=UPI001B889FA3|nr:toll-like receptor 2 [Gigantopelta aegis]